MPKHNKPIVDFSLPPKDAISYLKEKGYKLSFDYNELMKEANHKAFTVAKVTRLDLLHDIHNSITQAMEDGQRFEDWKKQLTPTLEQKGWFGKKDIINPKTGEVKKVNIDGHRLRNIFKTNTRVSRSIGRYKQMRKDPIAVYWKYIGGLSENPRLNHLAPNGKILHRDDPWWDKNYPPNGWGCQCRVRAFSKRDIEKHDWSIDKGGEDIASKDWDYNIGIGSKVGKLSKINLDKSLNQLQKISQIKQEAYAHMSEDDLKKQFFKTLGIKEGEIFIDKVGDPMVIDDKLFTSASGHSKIKKQDRHLYLDEIAKTITNPDEIYLAYDEKNNRLIKKMFKYYQGEKGSKRAMQVAFEYLPDKTQGVTAYFVKGTAQVENRRYEKLIYKGQE